MILSNPALLFKVVFVIMNGLVIYSPQMSWNILSLGLKFIRQLSRLIEPSYHLEKKKSVHKIWLHFLYVLNVFVVVMAT